MRLVKASEIQEMDRLTIQEMGIPGIVLMENAARGAAGIFLDHFEPPENSHVVVLCGPGNNGGDGYVAARYLHEKGLKTTVIVLAPRAKIKGDALTNLEIIRRMDLDILECPGIDEWASCRPTIETGDFIIDGLLGTGLNAPVRGFYATVIEDVNTSGKPVMAIDIPSGLNADTGQILGKAVRATLTVTFGFPKLGQLIFPGASLVGRLANVQIGIPKAVADRVPDHYHLVEPAHFTPLLRSDRQDIHKGDRGHLLVLSGSTGKTGAAALTALGALRAGAGLVTVGIPASLNPILENKLTEAMTFPLPETGDGSLSLEAEKEILRLMEGKTAVAVGPGLSTHEETTTLVKRIVAQCPLPMVIDADGLTALSGETDLFAGRKAETVLTPHPGEMARLSGLKTTEVQSDRLGTAVRFVERHGCFLVLKGARTLIVEPDGRVYVNPTGNPALSSGGSGDVLTGLMGGFLARGWPMAQSAVGAVYLHGLAADLLAEDMGQAGMLAGELLDVIPELMDALAGGVWPLESPPLHEDVYHPRF
jgi:ADP-dependent NAD(P)H-hydrate dehydratase / NAD(P)H-hydrate epimerase